MMNEPFIIAFVLALISEIADKTQLVIPGLALKYNSPLKVFSGALLAHAFMDGIAILLGAFFGFTLSSVLVKNSVGTVFIILGLWGFYKLYRKTHRKESRIPGKTPFTISLLTVMISEFGDKTQIASGLLSAKYLVPIPIFMGFVLALAAAIGFNVFVGSKIAQKLPRRTIKMITAVLFVLFGLFALVY